MKLVCCKNKDIDYQRYDQCIKHSADRLMYAYSWYLDLFSPGWHAIVAEDYSVVCPLPVKNKMGIKYIVQPLFTKQLGVFFKNDRDSRTEKNIYDLMLQRYKYIRLAIHKNSIDLSNLKVKSDWHKNHELQLKSTYQEIRKNYKKRGIENIRRAIRYDVVCDNNLTTEEFIEFSIHNTLHLDNNKLIQLKNIFHNLIETGSAKLTIWLCRARNKNSDLIAVSMYILDENRIYCMYNGSNPEGKKTQAMYLLTDYFIQNHANDKRVLDFTGSNIESIAYFLQSFGSHSFEYQYLEYVKPTSLVRFIK